MGLIYDILKSTKTKKLDNPIVQIATDRITSKMERQHMETIQRIDAKRAAKQELTNKDRREFRSAVNGLKRRGLAKVITEVEVDK